MSEEKQVPIPIVKEGAAAVRQAIIDAAKPESEQIEFFGQMIELRQPTMRAILELQDLPDKVEAASQMVINYAFVPGTNEKVFESTDLDTIAGMPFGKDMQRLNDAIQKLTDIDVLGEEKNSITQQ